MTSLTGNRGATGGTAGGKPMKEKIPSGYKKATLQQFTPEQLELFQNMMQHVGPDSFLSRLAGGDQSMFEQMEAPALKQFSGLQGNIASRFSGGIGGGGPGALSSRRSSGFQNTMNQASSDFAQNLQSQRMNYQNQAIRDLMQMSHSLMSERPYEHSLVQKPQNEWANIAGKFAGAIPGAVTGFLTGGPVGAGVGAASSVLDSGGGYNALPGLEDQYRTGQAYL